MISAQRRNDQRGDHDPLWPGHQADEAHANAEANQPAASACPDQQQQRGGQDDGQDLRRAAGAVVST